MRRRIWCETLPLEALASPAVTGLLRRFEVSPIVAVWPDTLDEAAGALGRLAGEGVSAAVWPMLSDAEGRWLGAANATSFLGFAERAAEVLGPAEIFFDLEPPIGALKLSLADLSRHVHVLPSLVDPGAFDAARAGLAALVDRLRARGIAASSAVAPPALFPGWEERLGTPVSGVAWDHVSPMLYTSIIAGWSRGLLDAADARALLVEGAAAAAARFGDRAGASLGAVGTGAFGDEPTYASPADLAADVALCRAAGVDDLSLFDLGGVLRRAPAEAWLEAFTATPAAGRLPPPTLRARAALAGMKLAGGAFGWLRRRGSPSTP